MIKFQVTFKEPYLYALLNKKVDRLYCYRKMVADQSLVHYNATAFTLGNNYSVRQIPMQFDYRNEKMDEMRSISGYLFYVMIAIIAIQFVALFVRNVGFLPLWTLLEYMQLIAFMPIYNFKLIPYLYDIFKPFLVAHLILFEESLITFDMENEYFNHNYEYFDLPVSKLL